jgi:hypothetical protein
MMASIRITHTHTDGTILTGSAKGDGVWEIAKAKGWSYRPVPGIFIRGSRDHHPQSWRIEQTKRALEAAGHTVTVELDDKARPTADVEADRDEQLADRQDALRDKADRLGGQAAGRLAAERAILDMIPPGQPILVDHYSAPRHRRDLARADNHRRKGMELQDRSREAARKAAGSEAWQRLRKSGPTTERRIQGLEADRRQIERYLAPCELSGRRTKEGTNGRTVRCAFCGTEDLTITDRQIPEHRDPRRGDLAWGEQRLAEIDDQLGYWRAYLQALIDAEVYRQWGPDDFEKGDWIHYWGGWAEALRINPKSVTVSSGYSWNSTITYDKIDGRKKRAELTPEERAAGYVANIRDQHRERKRYAADVANALLDDGNLPELTGYQGIDQQTAEQVQADLRRLLTEGGEQSE